MLTRKEKTRSRRCLAKQKMKSGQGVVTTQQFVHFLTKYYEILEKCTRKLHLERKMQSIVCRGYVNISQN